MKTAHFAAAAALVAAATPAFASDPNLVPIGSYAAGIFDESAAEIPAYDPFTQQLFVTNSNDDAIDVLDVSNPFSPSKITSLSTPGINSVAVFDGLVAAAVEGATAQDPGSVLFFDTTGNTLGSVTVGALPDMLTFTPDGTKLLVANEGEPNEAYTDDPEGSVSIIDLDSSNYSASVVNTAGFTAFNTAPLDPSIRIFGPGATVAQDLEPEYIAVSEDGTKAFVSLQENNAVAVVDIATASVSELLGLGFKDHSVAGNELDASDEDGGVNITTEPILGMYQPDALASYTVAGTTYFITANEGDARGYDGFDEEERVEDLSLDAAAYPNAANLQLEENLGRLEVTTATGDTDGDGDIDQIYSYGARSFSIYDDQGNLIYDSGNDFETITAATAGVIFNANNDDNDSFESRSDAKGPEPEGLTIGEFNGKTLAFIGLERVGGVMVYDITDPDAPVFEQYVNPRDFSLFPDDSDLETAVGNLSGPVAASDIGDLDLGPEGLLFIDAADSPIGLPLLVVTNEVSGTTTIYTVPEPATLAALGMGLLGLATRRRRG